MTTDNPNPTGAPAPPAPAPSPAGGPGVSADFDSAVRRDNAGHAERATSLSTSDIHAEAKKLLADPKSAYWQSGPEHDHAVATVFRSRELQAAAEGNGPTEEMPVSTMLANRAINIGQMPISEEAKRNPQLLEQDPEFRHLMVYAGTENIGTPTLNRMLTSYANMLAATGGQITDAGIAMMEREVGHELHPAQKALLTKWLKQEVAPALAREAARRGRGR